VAVQDCRPTLGEDTARRNRRNLAGPGWYMWRCRLPKNVWPCIWLVSKSAIRLGVGLTVYSVFEAWSCDGVQLRTPRRAQKSETRSSEDQASVDGLKTVSATCTAAAMWSRDMLLFWSMDMLVGNDREMERA
jgi:hypothetical protein